MSVSCSSKCVAKLWRSVCGDTRFLMPPASAAAWTARLSWRVESGSSGFATGKQPSPRQQHAQVSALPPPGAQQLEQLRRQHGVAVLAALSLLDAQQHALGVDIANLECD